MKKYKLIDIIGNGTFSTVYKAKTIRTNKDVAIKVATNKDNQSMDVLIREAKIYNQLKHITGIPQLYWCGRVDDMYYVVMPLYIGTIKTYTVENIEKLYEIGNNLLEILKNIHSMCIVHRDIKPDNIMFDSKGNFIIIDLGLCAIYNTDEYTPTPLGGILGTPNYISLNVHELITPYMKDDTESLMYVLLYVWNNNTLPWMNTESLVDIKNKKNNIRNLENVCIPIKILEYLCKNDYILFNKSPSYIL